MIMNIVIIGITGAIFLIMLIFILMTGRKAKGQYDEYTESVDEKEYPAKKFLHIGFYLNEYHDLIQVLPFLPREIKLLIGKNAAKTKAQITELYGAKYADYYYLLFAAQAKVYAVLLALGAALLALMLCAQNDAQTGLVILILGLGFAFALPFLMNSTLKTKIEKRHSALRIEFPEFVNKLVLLVNAGMTVSRALEKIIDDNQKNTPLQQELKIMQISLKDGTPEAYAIEAFGRRCQIKEITKFTSVLIANLKKGGSEIVPVLIQQSEECWEMRKDAAKELGAQAGVKMMLPMVCLLVAIIVVVGAPAVMMMGNM